MNRMLFRNTLCLLLAMYIFPGECDVLYRQAGDDISLKCGAPSNSDVEWKLNDIMIVYVYGKRGTKRKGSSHLESRFATYEGTLKISKLETRDSGIYSCIQSGKKYTVHVVSVFVKPDRKLLLSSDAELHCNVEGDATAEVLWLRPPHGQQHTERKQKITLKSVTSNDGGQWTCQVQDISINVTLIVDGLQTQNVIAQEGKDIVLPCSLPWVPSKRVVGGTWKAEHRPEVSFPTLQNTNNTLQWKGQNSSEVTFTSGELSTNYNITLHNVQLSNEGMYVCTVKMEGGATLKASTMLTVVPGHSGKTGTTPAKGEGPWTKDVFGVQLWVWIAVGASSLVLIGLIILTVHVQQRNKQMKKRARKRRSMRQPLTAKDYCQCNRSEREVELGKQVRPVPVSRQQRNAYHSPKPSN